MAETDKNDGNREPHSAWLAHEDGLFLQSSKGIMALNAGALIAVLGLLQAMYGKGDAAVGFKGFAVFSGILYLIGAMSALWMSWSRFEFKTDSACRLSSFLEKIGRKGKGAFYVSALSFVLGSFIALFGVVCSVR